MFPINQPIIFFTLIEFWSPTICTRQVLSSLSQIILQIDKIYQTLQCSLVICVLTMLPVLTVSLSDWLSWVIFILTFKATFILIKVGRRPYTCISEFLYVRSDFFPLPLYHSGTRKKKVNASFCLRTPSWLKETSEIWKTLGQHIEYNPWFLDISWLTSYG